MKQFGRTLMKLRKANGWTQDELGEALHVSRQTISSWERDQREPDLAMVQEIATLFHVEITDLFEAKQSLPYARWIMPIFWGSTVLQIGIACNIIQRDAAHSIGGIIALLVMFFMNAVIVLLFGAMIRSKDYSLLAGYDDETKYDLQEVAKMLQHIRMHCSISNLLWTVLLLLFLLFSKQQFWPLCILGYTFDFIFSILFENQRSRKRIFLEEKDQTASERAILSIVVYVILTFAWVLCMGMIMSLFHIQNNTVEALLLAGILILMMGINTGYLCYAQNYAKKSSFSQRKNKRMAIWFSLGNLFLMAICVLLGNSFSA